MINFVKKPVMTIQVGEWTTSGSVLYMPHEEWHVMQVPSACYIPANLSTVLTRFDT